MQLAASDILIFLLIIAAAMLIIVLYHVIFIVIHARRITERMDDVTEQVEGVMMKPLQILEESMTWLTEFLMNMYGEGKDHHKKHK